MTGAGAGPGSGDTLRSKVDAVRSEQAMAGERRTVTMLFADVKGSTSAAEQMDPEDWAEVINGAFERMIRPIHRYEGTLTRLQGDAVLAFFGAPIAHEDDPERAVMAGLEMLESFAPFAHRIESEWGIPMQVRVGVNTGLVVVGEVGSDLRVEYSALGDAVNIAARMEQTAEPGTVQISEDTHRLVAQLFDFEELGPIELKGKSEPIETFRPLRRRPDAVSVRGLNRPHSRLVGRENEIAVLVSLADGLATGRGSICTIAGDAGFGKSRLIAELRADLETSGRLGPWWSSDAGSVIGWGEGRALSYNATVPYWLIADLIGYCLDIHPDDPTGVRLSKLTDALEALVPQGSEELAPYLATLLGISDSDTRRLLSTMAAPLLQRRTFDAVTTLVEASASARPLILVLEDLHWADAVSLALVEELMAVTDRSRLMMVIAMRPNREEPSWRVAEHAARRYAHRYTALVLEPLDDEATAAMVAELMGGGVDDAVRSALIARADGNPFYVEEMISSLIDAGTLVEEAAGWRAAHEVGAIEMSPTITGLLTSRLDRLDEDARILVQLASVIGREFRLSELRHLAAEHVDLEETVAELLRRNLLEERAHLPERVYAFRHALVQETAYNSILRRARRRLHARIAAFLEETRPADVQEIALHLVEAGEGARAFPYLVEAGDRAVRAMSLGDAIRSYDLGLRVAGDLADPDLVRRAYEGLGGAYTLIPDLTHAATAYQDLLEFGRATAHPRTQVTALNRLGFASAALGGDYERAAQYLEDARRLAEESNDELGLAEYHINSCMIATGRGDMEQAALHDAGASSKGTAAGSLRLRMQGFVQRAISLANGGLYDDGDIALEDARRAAEESGDDLFAAAVEAIAAPPYLLRRGAAENAYEAAREGFEVIDRRGSSWAGETAMMAGYIGSLIGRYEEALALSSKSVRLGVDLGQPYISAASAAQIARIYGEAGADADRVAEWTAAALAYLEEPLGGMFAATIWGQLGWAQMFVDDLDAAGASFEKSLTGSSATRYMERPRSLLGAARVHHLMGDVGAATTMVTAARDFVDDKRLSHLGPSVSLAEATLAMGEGDLVGARDRLGAASIAAEEMGLKPDHIAISAALGKVHSALADHDSAATAWAAAQRSIEEVAARIIDEDLRMRYLSVVSSTLELPAAGAL